MRDKKCYHKLTIKCHVNKSSNSNTAIIQEHGGCPLPASTTTTTKSAKTELTQSAAREKLRKLYLVQIIPAAYANSMNGCNCVCVCHNVNDNGCSRPLLMFYRFILSVHGSSFALFRPICVCVRIYESESQ